MLAWDKAQQISALMEVVTQESRRDTLRVLLKAEGVHLTRAVPTATLCDAHALAEFIRLNSKQIEEPKPTV